MNRRLRKKKHLREFDYKGFEILCVFFPLLSESEVDDFLDEFLEYLEANDLGSGGCTSSERMEQFVTKCVPTRRKSNGKMHYKNVHCTDLDREKVKAWIESKVSLKTIIVLPLVGAWNEGK